MTVERMMTVIISSAQLTVRSAYVAAMHAVNAALLLPRQLGWRWPARLASACSYMIVIPG